MKNSPRRFPPEIDPFSNEVNAEKIWLTTDQAAKSLGCSTADLPSLNIHSTGPESAKQYNLADVKRVRRERDQLAWEHYMRAQSKARVDHYFLALFATVGYESLDVYGIELRSSPAGALESFWQVQGVRAERLVESLGLLGNVAGEISGDRGISGFDGPRMYDLSSLPAAVRSHDVLEQLTDQGLGLESAYREVIRLPEVQSEVLQYLNSFELQRVGERIKKLEARAAKRAQTEESFRLNFIRSCKLFIKEWFIGNGFELPSPPVVKPKPKRKDQFPEMHEFAEREHPTLVDMLFENGQVPVSVIIRPGVDPESEEGQYGKNAFRDGVYKDLRHKHLKGRLQQVRGSDAERTGKEVFVYVASY